ncbi:hypothetical protein L3Y34_002494 [Caenorhabditis briggsae]|uniref:C2H2-type domain-containing protein n=2 Tax=Caenorhabditis briggsae TaxID=6238 RepID=A0AAE9ISN4_CAEBR|nr:hypothetical protein L3Y34_002494 [Caenorhabditis briggsae]
MDADSLDESSVRRSYRLKDKPAREYAYKNFLRKDYIPPAVVKVNQKYDELFSSVVSNAFMMDIQKTPDQYYAEKAAQQLQNPPESDSDSEDVIQLDDSSEDVIEVDVLESRLTDIKKQLKETKKSVKAIRRKQRYAEKAAARIAADLLKFSKKSVVKELKMRNSESTSSSTSSDIEILETVPMEHPCSCGQVFEDHMECHRHIFEEHADNDVTGDCVHCGHRREQIFAGNGCYICYKFAPNLDEHLAGHYRNCTAKHAVMECRFCPKQFKTVKEVVAHEQKNHLAKTVVRKPTAVHKCNECSMGFISPEALLSHYQSHVDLNLLHEKIDQLQSRINAEVGECPFCRLNFASRKCFKNHLLRSHWLACKSVSNMSLEDIKSMGTTTTVDDQKGTVDQRSDEEIRKEINELSKMAEVHERMRIVTEEMKREVKDEIEDDGYHGNY